MLSFQNVLSRADVPTLEKLIGGPAVKLLKILDTELVRGPALRRILTKMRTPVELLFDRTAWNELIDLLSEQEATELADICGLNKTDDPWATLRTVRLRRGKRGDDVCSFFGLSIPQVNEDDVPSEIEVQSEYQLFKHQRDACRAAMVRLKQGSRRVVLHMPTGAGKTRTAMHIISRHLIENECTVAIWLAYSEELCEQAASEFEVAWRNLGDRPVSLIRFWGGHQEDLSSCGDGLIVAGLGKTYSRAIADLQFIARLAERVGLIVIDEAHQAVARTYSLVLNTLQSKRKDTALLGLTATPGRSWDNIDEDRKLADFFANQKVSLEVEGYANPMEFLIDHGYLARPTFRSLYYEPGETFSDADLRAIEEHLDIPDRVLERLGDEEQRNLSILVEVEKLADSHNRILVFAASLRSARIISTALEAHGRVDANVITGETPPLERQRIIQWYKARTDSPRVLCNFGVLTFGFDAPRTSAAVIGRPTKSLVLYSQMVGRALRGVKAGGNETAEVVTVVDTRLPGFRDLAEAFTNWEDAGWESPTT